MPTLTSRLARIGVCVALALPVLSSPVNAEGRRAVSYQERVAQSQRLTEQRMGYTTTRAAYDSNASQAKVQTAAVSNQSLKCLTEALYFEARGESVSGQRAVAEVILNRVDHPAFPKSVCGVVNQSGQFSYKGGSLRMRDRGSAYRAERIAREALAGAPRALTNGATYFHTTGVRPGWSKRFVRTTRIGSHIFYRRGGSQRVASN